MPPGREALAREFYCDVLELPKDRSRRNSPRAAVAALEDIATALGLPKARIIKALKLVLRTMTEREEYPSASESRGE
jgi:hypothetical protein